MPKARDLAPLLWCVWLLGFGVSWRLRLLHWLRLRAVIAEAHDLPLSHSVRTGPDHSVGFAAGTGTGGYPRSPWCCCRVD